MTTQATTIIVSETHRGKQRINITKNKKNTSILSNGQKDDHMETSRAEDGTVVVSTRSQVQAQGRRIRGKLGANATHTAAGDGGHTELTSPPYAGATTTT